MNTLVYLACPYSHPDPRVMEARFQAVNKVASRLMRQGMHIFSPISHMHPIALAGDLPKGFDYWREYDTAILRCCRMMIVLMLPGWKESKGVQAEMALAKDMGIRVRMEGYQRCDYAP